MAVQATPYVETALSHSAELFRREQQKGLPFGSAGGVVPATPAASANLTAGVAGCSDLQVSAPASGMSVNISAGQIIVPGSLGSGAGYGMGIGYGYPVVTLNGGSAPTIASNAHATQITLTTQGAYYCYNDNSSGAVSLAISAANASNPRIDVVGAQVEDSAYSGSNNDWKLAVVTGTAAASPTIPTFPANFVPLALVWVPTNATNIVAGDILDLRVAYNRNPFVSQVYATNASTLGNNAFSVLTFNVVATDLTGMWTNTTTVTAPVSGIYLASGAVQLAAAGNILLAAFKNGSGYKNGTTSANSPGGPVNISNLTCVLELNKSDTVNFQANQNVGAAANNAAGQATTYMDLALVTAL